MFKIYVAFSALRDSVQAVGAVRIEFQGTTVGGERLVRMLLRHPQVAEQLMGRQAWALASRDAFGVLASRSAASRMSAMLASALPCACAVHASTSRRSTRMFRANSSSPALLALASSSASRWLSARAASSWPRWAAPSPRAKRDIASAQGYLSQARLAGTRTGMARRFLPVLPLECVACARGRQVKRSLEAGFQVFRAPEAIALRPRVVVIVLLQVGVYEVLDGVRKFVPHQFAVFAGRSLERRVRREQVAADHAVPVAEARIDMRRHVQRMRIVRRGVLVLVRDLELLVLAARHVVGVHEVMHGARMIGILLVDAEQDGRGLVRVLPRNHVRRHDREVGERIERRRIFVVGQRAR
mgnify:CR=1 FL=1